MAYTQVKSPIVYYGGKTAIINHLLEMVPMHEVYTETFFGGGALFWAKDPAKNETINDRLDVVINFYRVLRTDFRNLKKLIDTTLISRTMYQDAANYLRAHKYGVKVDSVSLAWAFWMHSNFSHMHKIMGGYKQQKEGGKSIAKELSNKKKEFTDLMVARIENVTIENEHWKKVANARDGKRTFHYLDPSYPGTSQGEHHKFTWQDFEELLEWGGNDCIGNFLLSAYNSPMLNRYIKKYEWNKKEVIHSLKTPRNKGTQTLKTEVLVSNYSTACGTLKLFGNYIFIHPK